MSFSRHKNFIWQELVFSLDHDHAFLVVLWLWCSFCFLWQWNLVKCKSANFAEFSCCYDAALGFELKVHHNYNMDHIPYGAVLFQTQWSWIQPALKLIFHVRRLEDPKNKAPRQSSCPSSGHFHHQQLWSFEGTRKLSRSQKKIGSTPQKDYMGKIPDFDISNIPRSAHN